MARTRILIVHPDPDALATLGLMLRSPQFEIIETTGGHAVLRILEKPPGLVLIGVDGDEADAQKLLAYILRKYPRTPVLFLVTTNPGRCSQALHMGASAVLKFPLPANQLRAAVAQALESGGMPPRGDESGDRAGRPLLGNPLETRPGGTPADEAGRSLGPLKGALAGPEREIIVGALEAFGGNRQETARALGISRTTLARKMKKYGLLGEGDR